MRNSKTNLTATLQDNVPVGEHTSENGVNSTLANQLLNQLKDLQYNNADNSLSEKIMFIHNTFIHTIDPTIFDKEVQENLWLLSKLSFIIKQTEINNYGN